MSDLSNLETSHVWRLKRTSAKADGEPNVAEVKPIWVRLRVGLPFRPHSYRRPAAVGTGPSGRPVIITRDLSTNQQVVRHCGA